MNKPKVWTVADLKKSLAGVADDAPVLVMDALTGEALLASHGGALHRSVIAHRNPGHPLVTLCDSDAEMDEAATMAADYDYPVTTHPIVFAMRLGINENPDVLALTAHEIVSSLSEDLDALQETIDAMDLSLDERDDLEEWIEAQREGIERECELRNEPDPTEDTELNGDERESEGESSEEATPGYVTTDAGEVALVLIELRAQLAALVEANTARGSVPVAALCALLGPKAAEG